MVREEIVQMLKGLVAATICPTLALQLIGTEYSQGFCGITAEHDVGYHVFLFGVIMIASDFSEFFYHFCGHNFAALWDHHRAHHKFYNPSPFAVIADEYLDQFVRYTAASFFISACGSSHSEL